MHPELIFKGVLMDQELISLINVIFLYGLKSVFFFFYHLFALKDIFGYKGQYQVSFTGF